MIAIARPAGELDERVLQRRHRAVALEVIRLDVVDDRHGRMEREERLVVLVGFDHEQIVARRPARCHPRCSPARRRSRSGSSPAAVSASVVMTVVVVLPWVPEIATDARARDQLGQRLLAGHDRETQLPGPLQLGMVRAAPRR